MKTKILIAILSIWLFSTTSMLAQEKVNNKTSHKQMEKTAYTCPIHADVKSDKPSDCTKCGMALIKTDVKKATNQHCDMPKKGSCCPKEAKAQNKKTDKKTTCSRPKKNKITETKTN